MAAHEPLPWYRHRWPWLLMAGPAAVVVAGVVTTCLAIRSNDGLVDDDYYKQGLAVNQIAARDQAAARMGLSAELLSAEDKKRIRVVLRCREGIRLPEAIGFRATHPTRSGIDQYIVLQGEGEGLYTGQVFQPFSERWHVTIEDEEKTWRLTGEWTVQPGRSVIFPPGKKPQTTERK